MTHLPDWLARRAQTHPNHPALIAPDGEWTFTALDAWATALAAQCTVRGVDRGAVVALLLRNSPAFVALIHAGPRAGATLLPLNTRLTDAELAWQIADARPALLLCDAAHAEKARQAAGGVPVVDVAELLAGPQVAATVPVPVNLDAPYTLLYTSGTTGRPKGAVLTAGNHWWSATGSALNLGLHADDRWLAPLPLFHVGGLAIVLRGAIYGMTVVLPESTDATALNRAIDQHNVTIVSVVATLLQRMLDERAGRPFPASFRCALLGGGPAPRPLLERCAALGVPVVQTYGMTETASQVVTLAPADALRKLGSAGLPLLPNAVQVVAEDGAQAQAGQVGEIVVRGPSVFAGYHGAPEATGRAVRDGWLFTGDLGYLDAEGFLYVVDRRTDLIISGGENIYPAELEAALLAHPAVAEAGVFGAADATWGQVPVAAVVLRPGTTAGEDELLAHCRGLLARYKVPRRVEFRAALPRTASGKIQRHLLRG